MEAHGSGTRLGDMIEIDGLRRALGPRESAPMLVGSVKTNLGHLDRAAGLAGLAKVVAQLRHEAIYASLHFEQSSPLIDFDNAPVAVATSTTPWPAEDLRYAGVSSFSMSGTNAHAVLAGAPAVTSFDTSLERGVATVSARSWPALQRSCLALADHLETAAPAALGDILRVLNLGRDHWPFRVAVPAGGVAGLATQLRSAAARVSARSGETLQTRSVVWVCADDDTLSAETAGRLSEQWPAYADALAECAHAAPSQLDVEDLEWFSRQYAAARLAESLGVTLAHAVGTGRGVLVADALAEGHDVAASLSRLAVGDLPEGPEPAVPAWLLFESLVLCGPAPTSVIEVPAGAVTLKWADDVLANLAALFELGADIAWAAQHTGPGRRVALPTYSFEPTRVWVREPAAELGATCAAVVPTSCALEAEVCSLDSVEPGTDVETGPLDIEELERIVCASWGEVLGLAEVSVDADYFDLGGTSAMALQMLTTIRRRFGVRMKLIELYETRTARLFAARVAELRAEQLGEGQEAPVTVGGAP
jgi:acyl transferase domain-containing protein